MDKKNDNLDLKTNNQVDNTRSEFIEPISKSCDDKKIYFIDKTYEDNSIKSTVNGWMKDGVNWYYYENGQMVIGWKYINSYWYYFQNDGKMKRGWLYTNGYYYYFFYEGQMATGWQNLEGKFYYFYSDGKMAIGWSKINNEWYYLLESGGYQTGWLKLDGVYYYFYSDGKMATGWLQLNDSWFYLDSNGKMQTGWKKIKELWYYFYSDGKMATGWDRLEGKTYYFYQKKDTNHKEGSMALNTIIEGFVIDRNGVLVDGITESNFLTMCGNIGIFKNSIIGFTGLNVEKTLPLLLAPNIEIKGSISLHNTIYFGSGDIYLTAGSSNELAYNITSALTTHNIKFDFKPENISESLITIGTQVNVNDKVVYKIDSLGESVKITFEFVTSYKNVTIYQDMIIIINNKTSDKFEVTTPLFSIPTQIPSDVVSINGLKVFTIVTAGFILAFTAYVAPSALISSASLLLLAIKRP